MGFKKYKQQDFKSLKRECKRNKRFFEDPEFPAARTSLCTSKQLSFDVEWKRPKVRVV